MTEETLVRASSAVVLGGFILAGIIAAQTTGCAPAASTAPSFDENVEDECEFDDDCANGAVCGLADSGATVCVTVDNESGDETESTSTTPEVEPVNEKVEPFAVIHCPMPSSCSVTARWASWAPVLVPDGEGSGFALVDFEFAGDYDIPTEDWGWIEVTVTGPFEAVIKIDPGFGLGLRLGGDDDDSLVGFKHTLDSGGTYQFRVIATN